MLIRRMAHSSCDLFAITDQRAEADARQKARTVQTGEPGLLGVTAGIGPRMEGG